MTDVKQRFLYHGSALAVGGRVMRPYCELIEPQAVAVLPTVGGHSTARVENFRFRDLISFRSASSTVSGSQERQDDGTIIYNTLATTTIEGLDVAGVVTADRIVARLVSEHSGKDEVPIQLVGTHFERLRIAGVEIEPQPLQPLLASRTLAAIEKDCRKYSPAPLDGTGKALRFPIPDRGALTSLFAPTSQLASGCLSHEDWGIKVEGLGVVYLGEMLVSRGARMLTMVRINLGSPIQAEASIGEIRGNGTTYP